MTENDKVTGIEVNNSNNYFADKIIINADPAFTYKNLIKTNYNRKWNNKRLKKLDYSMGLFVLYFGTKKQFNNIPHHTIWMGKRYEGLLDDIFKNKVLAEDFSLYLHSQQQLTKRWHQKDVIVFMYYLLYLICYQELIGINKLNPTKIK